MPAAAAPILVTGSHRSGTTWVGRILASAPSTVYLHEPFHRRPDPDTAGADTRFDCWFTYVCRENEQAYRAAIEDVLARAARAHASNRPTRPIVKDPLAVFSAPWFADRFQTRNVVLVRHPAAFAASLKHKGWTHPFADFLRQPLLMAHHLDPFAGEIMRFTRQAHDVVDQAALLWRLIYSVVLQYQRDFPGWTYVRHEDLVPDPPSAFRTLFAQLDLDYGVDAERAIAAHRRTEVADWRERLTDTEIQRVRIGVGTLADRFYADADW
ncbi:MAG TPA: sulfotransferase [Vicinamibacterales bacterium]|nr:sulfotransferase [Vicinamibacterales bacterium]